MSATRPLQPTLVSKLSSVRVTMAENVDPTQATLVAQGCTSATAQKASQVPDVKEKLMNVSPRPVSLVNHPTVHPSDNKNKR